MALTVVSQIFPKDMIPAILPLVEEKLNHPKYDMPLPIYYIKYNLAHKLQLNIQMNVFFPPSDTFLERSFDGKLCWHCINST